MSSTNSRDRSLIAALAPHIDAAIRASSCTCATLRFDVILDLVLKYGLDDSLDPLRRTRKFRDLCKGAYANFAQAASGHTRYPEMRSLADKRYQPYVSASRIDGHNENLNSLYGRCGLDKEVRDCEELAVAYSASLRYAWANATTLLRYVEGVAELDSMLETREFRSNGHDFVAASATYSDFLSDRDVSYRITITEQYRRRMFPLTYTSVFATPYPEILHGRKGFRILEDEVRIKNGTPLEGGTLEITFHSKVSIPNLSPEKIIEKYKPLGTVRFKLD